MGLLRQVRMNAQERYDKFNLDEDDEKVENAIEIVLLKEDHTLGNLIRMQLHTNDNVLFSGYKVQHPLEHTVLLKVRCASQVKPIEAFRNSLEELLGEIKVLTGELNREIANA